MSLDTKTPAVSREDRSVGNIYDRLEVARRKRERVLETPAPANVDRRALSTTPGPRRAFPKLKPPRADMPEYGTAGRWDWVVPWLLGLAIFLLIFAFAVS